MVNEKYLFKYLIDKLYRNNFLNEDEIIFILENINLYGLDYLIHKADETRRRTYGTKVYMRGLIEISNYCKRQCKYCGINALNNNVHRYRLSQEDILECCERGYNLGFRTFVLQGGEDNYFTDSILVKIIIEIKRRYPDAAVTLSVGERDYSSYEKYLEAGADRYLLRHETVNKPLYESIHLNSNYENRIKSLWDLKYLGYQIGAGFMVGIPNQTKEDLARELLFLKELDPEMVGIGPFIPHKDTVYRDKDSGALEDTITMLALARLFLPNALIPSTTALASIHEDGRELGLKAGANVVMPNLSPLAVREDYSLYDGKAYQGYEGAECRQQLEKRINKAGYVVDMSRGDNIKWKKQR
ncbi:MAG: [FeFe] hydrogenase H-cluster radical SAM maturase HydE [Tissierellaceae bacterium]|nr:[FeFe] hydrogenase H-cluster radical SAM maturase HydE [Tissierellaceae bacterium]